MLSKEFMSNNNFITQIILKFMHHKVYLIVTCNGILNKGISTDNKQ